MSLEEMLHGAVRQSIAQLLDESAGHFLARRLLDALECLDRAQDASGQDDDACSPIGLTWGDMRALITRDWDDMERAYGEAVLAGRA